MLGAIASLANPGSDGSAMSNTPVCECSCFREERLLRPLAEDEGECFGACPARD